MLGGRWQHKERAELSPSRAFVFISGWLKWKLSTGQTNRQFPAYGAELSADPTKPTSTQALRKNYEDSALIT